MFSKSTTSKKLSAILLAGACLSGPWFVSATAFAADPAPEPDQENAALACGDVGLTGTTSELGDFCVKTSGELTLRLSALEAAFGTFNARLIQDVRLLSQEQFLRAVVALDVTFDSSKSGDDRYDWAESELFFEYEDVLVGRAQTAFEIVEPLNYLSLPTAWENPDYNAWQFRYGPTIGIFKMSLALEAPEEGEKNSDNLHYIFSAKSSEIWGDLSLSYLSRPIDPDSTDRGAFLAAGATIPVFSMIGTKVRIGAAYADGLVSYLGVSPDGAGENGWAAFISGEYLIGDEVTLAATLGKTDTSNSSSSEAVALSLAYEPDFDTLISAGVTYGLSDHETEVGVKLTHQFSDNFEISLEAKNHSATGSEAILELKSEF